MTKRECRAEPIDWKGLLASDPDDLRTMDEAIVQATLEAEMTAALGAEKGERATARLGDRSGDYGRLLITRAGTLELRVPQDRQGRFSTELFERYQRAEKAPVTSLIEMSVQGGLDTQGESGDGRAVRARVFGRGHQQIGKKRDSSLKAFCERRLTEAYSYLILDAG